MTERWVVLTLAELGEPIAVRADRIEAIVGAHATTRGSACVVMASGQWHRVAEAPSVVARRVHGMLCTGDPTMADVFG